MRLAFGFLLPALITAQPPALPKSWMGAGAAYNSFARPNVAGWASYATLISDRGQLYSFTSWDLTSARTTPWTAQTSVRTGLATLIRQAGPVHVLGFGDAGLAAAGTTTSGAFSGGGVGVIKLGSTNFTLVFAARILKTNAGSQTIYEFGIGRAQPQ